VSVPVWSCRCEKCRGELADGAVCPYCRNARYDEDTVTWKLSLSKYHRDNLVSLLTAIGYPHGGLIEPFHVANTGDWVGELWLDLQYPADKGRPDQPNATPADLRQRVEAWLKYREK
jgi:hypothetical protein